MRRLLGLMALCACACSEETTSPEPEPEPYDGPPIPWAYEAFPVVVEPLDNPSTEAKVSLGRLLFYDPVLSRDQLTACATCHSELWGMSDGLAVSIGVDGEGPTGPGRTGPNLTTRNAQTLWNAALRRELFWDGRSSSLEQQALEPLKAERELDLDPEQAAARIAGIPGYRPLFEAAFPLEQDPITPLNIAKALAAFERTLVSNRAPYDRYVQGDEGSLREEVRVGMELFAEAGCAGCHVPPLFESNRYERRLPLSTHEEADPGRMDVTGEQADRGKVRVPTLRNLRETGPYFHDGSVVELDDAVALEVEVAVLQGESRALSPEEVEGIVVFLKKGLMDRSREPDRPEEVPSGLPVPEDGFRIPR